MDNGLWKLQQEARVRVASQRAREHRVAADYDRRTAGETLKLILKLGFKITRD